MKTNDIAFTINEAESILRALTETLESFEELDKTIKNNLTQDITNINIIRLFLAEKIRLFNYELAELNER